MKKLILAMAVATAPVLSQAAVLPKATQFDNRIRYVEYNPDDVVVVKTKLGHATVIQLEAGEHLNAPEAALAIGDKNAWTVAVRENNVIIKPIADFPETNINIISNKRVYAFDLVEAKNAKDVSFFVRFEYPKPVERIKEYEPPKLPCSDGPVNYLYYKYGDADLAPVKVWDDGKFTCFKYPHNKPIPAVYKFMPGTELKEALVNFNMVGDTIVVQTTANEFRLRFGDKVMGIKTDNLQGILYNENRTATGEKREVIREQ